MEKQALTINYNLAIQACNAGLFISTGRGQHPSRIIDSYELIFVRSGVLGIQEEDCAFKVKAGESLLLWPNRYHWGTMIYPPDLSFYWIHFFLREEAASQTKLVIPQHNTVSRPECLIELFRRFLDDQESGYKNHQAGYDFLTALMLFEVMISSHQPTASKQAASLANYAEVYIKTHFHESISTALVAQELGCNPDYLGRVFQRVYGKTILERIHECRLHQAHSLLLNGVDNIEEIARKCGYENVYYFRQRFKMWKGITPTSYRKLYSQMHVNIK